MTFPINQDDALRLAKEYGLEINFDSPEPGVLIKNGDIHKLEQFHDFFPELNGSFELAEFVTQDNSELEQLSKGLGFVSYMENRVTVTYVAYFDNKKLIGAA